MKLTDEEKLLLNRFKELESQKCRDDVVSHLDAMVRAQEALKADYGLTGKLPLFNCITGLGLDRHGAPLGAAIPKEAIA